MVNGLEVEAGHCLDGEEAPSYLEIGLRGFEALLLPLEDIVEMRMEGVAESRREKRQGLIAERKCDVQMTLERLRRSKRNQK